MGCEKCGKALNKGLRFCSLHCANSAPRKRKGKIKYERHCEECNNVFVTVSKVQRFCTSSCSTIFNNRIRGYRECRFCLIRVYPPKLYCNKECEVLFKAKSVVEAWLISGIGNIKNKNIKSYILEDQGRKCAIDNCDVGQEWNGKPLIFIQDHINGDSTDNSRPNIRMVCSNCDSQLDTYKAKNKGKGRHFRRERYAEGKSY